MNNNIVVIVQARMGGTRFPGKVIHPLLGQPMILWQLDRISRMTTQHTLVVACPPGKENIPLVELCHRHGYNVMAPEVPDHDVLARYAVVAEQYNAAHVVRLTADCPLLDHAVVDACIAKYLGVSVSAMLAYRRPQYDHVGIAAEWPDGQDAEIFSRSVLEIANIEAKLPSDREHVTPFIYRNKDRFRCATLPCPFDLSWQSYSVDTRENMEDIENILSSCLPRHGHMFGWREIMQVLEYLPTTIAHMNTRIHNNAYMEQIATESNTNVQSWNAVRYQ